MYMRRYNPEDVELVYTDETGREHRQPVTDLFEAGTLVDPDTDEDMPITGVIVKNRQHGFGARANDAVNDGLCDARWLVTWAIHDTHDSATAVEAAARVWRDVFGRDTASCEDACLFEVFDRNDPGRNGVVVDLSDYDIEDDHLERFPQ